MAAAFLEGADRIFGELEAFLVGIVTFDIVEGVCKEGGSFGLLGILLKCVEFAIKTARVVEFADTTTGDAMPAVTETKKSTN